ncbi:General transcription factor IIF subunit 2 [Goodea atripinnis]|uniref:General transcription factor IIF subunit 2 n=1 Tax=Goodea atripinnis TaxID=208336 RepID=A0ABV0PXC5_9TELE
MNPQSFRTRVLCARVKGNQGKPEVSFTLNEELTTIEGIEDKTVSAPREHPFTMQSVGGQMLAVFTENSSGHSSVCLSEEMQ